MSSPTTSRVIAANPLRINTSSTPRICIKINNFNPFRIRTYESPNLAHKTKDFNPTRINTYALRPSKTFRINTYENKGEGGLRFHPHQYRLASRKIALYFQQFTTYPSRNSIRMISMRFYPGAGGGYHDPYSASRPVPTWSVGGSASQHPHCADTGNGYGHGGPQVAKILERPDRIGSA